MCSLVAGFYIRVMLLSGSQFKKQLIPETASLILLGFLTVLFSGAMQILLAYYLWTRLPPTFPEVNGNNISSKVYPGTSNGRSYFDWYSPPLPSYSYPNYKFANDVCRTVPIVQLTTIGLFLFSIMNNIPGVIKNFCIIWKSDRFISVDEEGITKLHFWRESSYMRKSADKFLEHLYTDFEKDITENSSSFGNGSMSIQKSIQPEPTANEGSWKMKSDISDLGRLRVIGQVSESLNATSTKGDQYHNTGVAHLEVKLVKAFLCEMYLSGSLIHGTKNKKIVQDYMENKKIIKEQSPATASAAAAATAAQPDAGSAAAAAAPDAAGAEIHADEPKNAEGEVEGKQQIDEQKAYAGAARRRWMLKKCFTDILPMKKKSYENPEGIHVPTSFFEVCETRSFLAEALRLMDQTNTKTAGISKDIALEGEPLLFSALRDNTAVWPPPIEISLWPQPIQVCDQVRLNLVRIDYLRPSKWMRPNVWSWLNEYEEYEVVREQKKLEEAIIKFNEINKINKLSDKQATAIERIQSSSLTRVEEEDQIKRVKQMFEILETEFEKKKRGLVKAANSLITDQKIREEKEHIEKAKCGSSIYNFLTCTRKNDPFTNRPKKPAVSELESEDLTQFNALQKFLGRDFKDVLTSIPFSHFRPSKMIFLRILAFTFGVMPELISLLFMAVAGVQYILWSGFKVDSDTQGMEEIILATLAINFIYEIDDAVYDHVLPELYKEAHERDRFDITGYWISSETSVILDKCAGTASSKLWHEIRKWCCFYTRQTETEIKQNKDDSLKMLTRCQPIVHQTPLLQQEDPTGNKAAEPEERADQNVIVGNETKMKRRLSVTTDLVFPMTAQIGHTVQSLADKKVKDSIVEFATKVFKEETKDMTIWMDRFDENIRGKKSELSDNWNDWNDADPEAGGSPFVRAMKMSVTDQWNDIYLAHAYPFLYARKLRYAFANHLWERFLVFYGMWGMHLVMLIIIAIAIVGGYRTVAQCDRFAQDSEAWLGVFAKQVNCYQYGRGQLHLTFKHTRNSNFSMRPTLHPPLLILYNAF
jgi:hypothetical protein